MGRWMDAWQFNGQTVKPIGELQDNERHCLKRKKKKKKKVGSSRLPLSACAHTLISSESSSGHGYQFMLTLVYSPVSFLAPPHAMVGTDGLMTGASLRVYFRASHMLKLAFEFHLEYE